MSCPGCAKRDRLLHAKEDRLASARRRIEFYEDGPRKVPPAPAPEPVPQPLPAQVLVVQRTPARTPWWAPLLRLVRP